MIKVINPSFDKELEKEILNKYDFKFKVFLAGTIDNGDSTNWQDSLIWHIKNYNHSIDYDSDESIGDILIYNPRRDDWDSTWSHQQIREQIEWEQEKLEEADLIIMNILDDSKSPISLLELGLYGPSGKLVCFCTGLFYRYDNVYMTCKRFSIPLYNCHEPRKIAEIIEKIYNECINC